MWPVDEDGVQGWFHREVGSGMVPRGGDGPRGMI
jgi:hypothetical protein